MIIIYFGCLFVAYWLGKQAGKEAGINAGIIEGAYKMRKKYDDALKGTQCEYVVFNEKDV